MHPLIDFQRLYICHDYLLIKPVFTDFSLKIGECTIIIIVKIMEEEFYKFILGCNFVLNCLFLLFESKTV